MAIESIKNDGFHLCHECCRFGKGSIGFLSETVKKTSSLDKLCKIGVFAIDLANQFHPFNEASPLHALRRELKVVNEFLGVLGFVSSVRDWVCPEKPGVPGKEKPFWLNSGTSKAKIIGKAFLTLGNTCDVLKFLNSYNLISLGIFSATVGAMPVLSLIKLGSILISANVNLIHCGCQWHKLKASEKKAIAKIDRLNRHFKKYSEEETKTSKIEIKLRKWKAVRAEAKKEKREILFTSGSELLKIAGVSLIIGSAAAGITTGPMMILLPTLGIVSTALAIYKSN